MWYGDLREEIHTYLIDQWAEMLVSNLTIGSHEFSPPPLPQVFREYLLERIPIDADSVRKRISLPEREIAGRIPAGGDHEDFRDS